MCSGGSTSAHVGVHSVTCVMLDVLWSFSFAFRLSLPYFFPALCLREHHPLPSLSPASFVTYPRDVELLSIRWYRHLGFSCPCSSGGSDHFLTLQISLWSHLFCLAAYSSVSWRTDSTLNSALNSFCLKYLELILLSSLDPG